MDAGTEEQLLKYLKKIAGEGKIILLLSHSEAGSSFCNKKINLDD